MKKLTVLSINGAGTTGYSNANNEIGPLPCTIYKNNQKWIINLTVYAKTIKFLEENIGVNLHDLGLSKTFLDMTLKALMTKDITQLKNGQQI